MFHNKDYIYCIYKEGSFSKAAEVLHIAQPSLSADVSRLEKRLGVQLFNRKTKPISVTPFGLEYIHAVEQIYEIEEHLQTLAYEVHSLQSGHLAIGGSSLDNPYTITQTIAQFKKRYPNIYLRIHDTNTVRSKQMLDAGELDLVITNRPMDVSKYEKLFCYSESLVWAIPQEFPINESLRGRELHRAMLGNRIFDVPDSRCVSAAELAEVPMILLDNTNYLRTCVDMIFQESRVEPIVALETENPSISYNFAMQGVGATIISNRLIENLNPGGKLLYYKLLSQYSKRNAYVYYSKGRYVTAAMKKFIELLQKDDR
ncbi:LysR family transcriptional regulator [Pseudoflavonifractor sp. HCP28S3_F10]|uniref:LysR family transcriptional regulator n=1 Tax=Pseudoflavonifractor sp. HCP28S3_F10 TaxID=3438947 RepID=UPI003F8BBE9A